MDKKELDCKICTLAVFSEILSDDTINNLWKLLDTWKEEMFLGCYAAFVSELYKENVNLSEYVLKKALEDENFYIIGKAQGKVFDSLIEEAVENELKILEELSRITPKDVISGIDYKGYLPEWRTSDIDFIAEYKKRIGNIGKCGYGIYAKYYMFIVKESYIVPVKYPDEIKLSQLIGYDTQRKMIIDNTLALLEGKPASNVLLTGDAGTGKSSSVKAIANEYRDMGLRIIEVRKDQLRDIPVIIDNLSRNPLKFILFIDDLTFSSEDDNFGALKAILEGSVSARADNIVIYATSNRRHLVKENFSDRDGDDMHRNDTIQELISLSERFGLKISFSKPNKSEYLEIVCGLAKQQGLDIPREELEKEAERFAVGRSGRSARTAKYFVEKMIAIKNK
ncbi:MAG: ATP-binding protein [Clostridium sp.]|nr:ATP-binding protein [Clostridium sp.]MCM1548053.1 ATP-binding protein [Ruminococcus sp.]